MIVNKKIIILIIPFFSYKIIFANDFYDEMIRRQKIKLQNDYNYVNDKQQNKLKIIDQDNGKVEVIDCQQPLNIKSKKRNRFFDFILHRKKQNKYKNNPDVCKEVDLYSKLKRSFKLNSQFDQPLVSHYEDYYFKHKQYFEDILQKSSGYISYIIGEVEKRSMPGEVALLPMVESLYKSSPVSKVGATGMWQFMPHTGKNYGLNQTNWYDGRKDFYASTDAALNYLQDLYRQFGDWELAISAYNVGENKIAKEVAKANQLGLEPKFENLNLPKETRHYLPKLIATRNFIINQDAYNFDFKNLNNPSKFVAVDINQPIDLDVVAQLSGVDIDYLKELNYGYKIPVIIPGKNRKLILPLESLSIFNNNLKNYDVDKLSKWIAYKSLKKENIFDLANKYNIPASQLKDVNHLIGNYIPTGKIILIPKNGINLNNYEVYTVSNKNNYFNINDNDNLNESSNNNTFLSLEEAEHDIDINNLKPKPKHNKLSHKRHNTAKNSTKPKRFKHRKKIYQKSNTRITKKHTKNNSKINTKSKPKAYNAKYKKYKR